MPQMAKNQRLLTAEDLFRLDTGGDRVELIHGRLRQRDYPYEFLDTEKVLRGEILVNPPPGARHGEIQLLLGRHLGNYVEAHDLGVVATECGFLVEPDSGRTRAPDVAFVRKSQVPAGGAPDGPWTVPPDLCVEILSPGDRYGTVLGKIQDWLAYGARIVILVEPKRRQLVVYRSVEDSRILSEGDVLDGGDVVPGWRLELRELFRC
jgi:Uma2 family endonuclease